MPAPSPGACPLRGDELVTGCSHDGAMFDWGSPLLCRVRKVPKALLAEMASRALWGSPDQPAP